MAWRLEKMVQQERRLFHGSPLFMVGVHMFMVVGLGGCRGGKEGAHGAEGCVIFIQLCGGVVFTLSAFALSAGDVFFKEFTVALSVSDGCIPAGDELRDVFMALGCGLEFTAGTPDSQG